MVAHDDSAPDDELGVPVLPPRLADVMELADALQKWLQDRPDADDVSFAVDEKRGVLLVYAKWPPSAEFRAVADATGHGEVLVWNRTRYSPRELDHAAVAVMEANLTGPGAVLSSGPNDDFSGLKVSLAGDSFHTDFSAADGIPTSIEAGPRPDW